MEKTQMLNVRVSPIVKQQAEDVLKQLGIPMATAIDMYLRQITLTGGIPFPLSLPKAPTALNADTMTDEQLHTALQAGIKELQNGYTICGEGIRRCSHKRLNLRSLFQRQPARRIHRRPDS